MERLGLNLERHPPRFIRGFPARQNGRGCPVHTRHMDMFSRIFHMLIKCSANVRDHLVADPEVPVAPIAVVPTPLGAGRKVGTITAAIVIARP